jgi:hypothetical protein
MQPDVNIGDKFNYNGDACLELYRGYLEGRETLDDFLRYLKRHIIMRVRKHYLRRIRRDVCEDLIQSALIELWRIADKKKIPSVSVQVFHKFVNTVIHRRIAKTFGEVYDDAPKKMDPVGYISAYYGKIPGLDDEESRVFLADLADTLKTRIMENIRFKDPRIVAAIEYILEQVLEFRESVVEAWLKRNWRIEDPKFLVEHVFVLLKAELYKIREDLKFRTNSEKRDVLHAGFEEFFEVGN